MSFWTSLRDGVESVAVLYGNYQLPGSSLLTSKLASKGSQKELGSTVGQLAQLGTGIAGGTAGNFGNYGKILDWATGGANTMANLFSSATPAAEGTQSTALTTEAPITASTAETMAQNSGIATTPGEAVTGKTGSLNSDLLGGKDAALNMEGRVGSGLRVQQGTGLNAGQPMPQAPSGGYFENDTGKWVPPAGTPSTSEFERGIDLKRKGLVQSGLDWAGRNQTLASAGVVAAGGLLKGAGESANTLELQKLKAKQAEDLQAQKLAQIQQGGYNGQVPVNAPRGRLLRRPDGSLVYQNTGVIGARVS